MARQVIAEDWKTVETLFDQRTQTFSTLTRNLGRFTAATAREKVEPLALGRSYTWRARPVHGFGGYWVNVDGDTIELLPGRA